LKLGQGPRYGALRCLGILRSRHFGRRDQYIHLGSPPPWRGGGAWLFSAAGSPIGGFV